MPTCQGRQTKSGTQHGRAWMTPDSAPCNRRSRTCRKQKIWRAWMTPKQTTAARVAKASERESCTCPDRAENGPRERTLRSNDARDAHCHTACAERSAARSRSEEHLAGDDVRAVEVPEVGEDVGVPRLLDAHPLGDRHHHALPRVPGDEAAAARVLVVAVEE